MKDQPNQNHEALPGEHVPVEHRERIADTTRAEPGFNATRNLASRDARGIFQHAARCCWFWVAALAALAFLVGARSAHGQGSAFTYAGQLQENGLAANGTYNFTFTLFDTNDNTAVVAGPVTNNAVGVTNGVFTALIDFGPGLFNGAANWLQVGVATNGVHTFTTLFPRQQLTPTPYAIFAESAGSLSNSGNVPVGSLTLTGNLSMPATNVSPDIIYSGNSLLLYSGPNGNFFSGPGAGNQTLTGIQNTAAGGQALVRDTTGAYNAAFGFGALANNTTGNENTALGRFALYYNISGAKNTATGFEALGSNTVGFANTADGVGALYSNTSGSNNVADGVGALGLNATGSKNTASGVDALLYNTTGSDNTAVGFKALVNNDAGSNNTAMGFSALYLNDTGTNNTAIGSLALGNSTDDNDLVAVGYQALENDDALGSPITSDGNGHNTAIGYQALQFDTSGSANSALGYTALQQNEDGNANTAMGDRTLLYNTSGSTNVAIGADALIGNNTGSFNTAIGYAALEYNDASYNTGIGYAALYANSIGATNTAIGVGALQQATEGNNNIALGFGAGFFIESDDNIDIGNYGSAADVGIIRIGTQGTQTATYLTGTVYADGVALTSDRNAKENFTPVQPAEVLAKVVALPISEWNYKFDAKAVQHIGPTAQDFHAAFPLSADDKHIAVVDEGGVALAAIQGLNQKLEQRDQSLQQKLDEKDAEIRDLKSRLERLEQLLVAK